MHRKGAIILPVLIVLIVISLSFGAVSFYLYQKEHVQNIQLQEQIADLSQRQRITENKLDDTKKTASELTLKLQETNSKVDSLNGELDQERSALTEATNKLEQVNADLAQQKSLRQDLEDRLKTATDEGKQIKDQIKIIQQEKAQLEEKIKNMEAVPEGVELGKVIVADPKSQKAGKKLAVPAGREGKIMIVNKEFNFAVISLGSRDNVSLGDEFSISREGKYIGDLKVEKVHEAMSAAGFSSEIRDLIKENDKITQKAK